MELSEIRSVVEKLLPIIVQDPYDDVKFRIYNNKGLYEINLIFYLPKELYDRVKSEVDSHLENTIIRFEAYRIVKTINNYLHLKLVINDIVIREKK